MWRGSDPILDIICLMGLVLIPQIFDIAYLMFQSTLKVIAVA